LQSEFLTNQGVQEIRSYYKTVEPSEESANLARIKYHWNKQGFCICDCEE